MSLADRIALAKSALATKPKLPKYVYKQSHGSTYYAKVQGTYLGSFPSVEAAAEAVAKVFE